MKIYTKTGDDGNTGLQGDLRISKSHERIFAYGAVDEANASLGVILSQKLDSDISEVLQKIQNELFILGSDLSNPNLTDLRNRVTKEMIENLELFIDRFETELEPLMNFILPGGIFSASLLHQSRTIIRRAETHTVKLSERDEINQNCIIYLNRLSDLFFVMSRLINKRNGSKDILWKGK